MTAEDIANKVNVLGRELGEYIESSGKILPQDESLVIAITSLMNALSYDVDWEKEFELKKAVREYLRVLR